MSALQKINRQIKKAEAQLAQMKEIREGLATQPWASKAPKPQPEPQQA
jgi:hypothetical protein